MTAKPERNAEIYNDRVVLKLSLREIAEKHGLTHQRVSQLLHTMGAPEVTLMSAREKKRRAAHGERLAALQEPVRAWLAGNQTQERGLKALAQSLGAKLVEVYAVAHALGWSGQPQVDLLAEGKRRCAGTCRQVKPLTDFHKNKRDRGGHSRVCKVCMATRLREYYLRKRQPA